MFVWSFLWRFSVIKHSRYFFFVFFFSSANSYSLFQKNESLHHLVTLDLLYLCLILVFYLLSPRFWVKIFVTFVFCPRDFPLAFSAVVYLVEKIIISALIWIPSNPSTLHLAPAVSTFLHFMCLSSRGFRSRLWIYRWDRWSNLKGNVVSIFKCDVNLKLSHQHPVNCTGCWPFHYHIQYCSHQSNAGYMAIRLINSCLKH